MVHMVFMQRKSHKMFVPRSIGRGEQCSPAGSPPHKIFTLIPFWVILSVVFPAFQTDFRPQTGKDPRRILLLPKEKLVDSSWVSAPQKPKKTFHNSGDCTQNDPWGYGAYGLYADQSQKTGEASKQTLPSQKRVYSINTYRRPCRPCLRQELLRVLLPSCRPPPTRW